MLNNKEAVIPNYSKRERGFSLLELLFVVGIISIVAALAIPSLQNSRKAAYESTTLSYLRSLVDAQEMYRLRSPNYAPDVATLVGAGLVPDPTSNQFGYVFAVGAATPTYWSVSAAPIDPGNTGDRYFFVDSTGLIRVAWGGAANAGSTPLNSTP